MTDGEEIDTIVEEIKKAPCVKCGGRPDLVYSVCYTRPFAICLACRAEFQELVKGLGEFYDDRNSNPYPKYFH